MNLEERSEQPSWKVWAPKWDKRSNASPSYGEVNGSPVAGMARAAGAAGSATAAAARALMAAAKFCGACASMVCHCDRVVTMMNQRNSMSVCE